MHTLSDTDCAEIITELMIAVFPQLKGRVRVFYRRDTPCLYAVRERKAGALLLTGISLSDPRLQPTLRRAALSCLEVIQHRTAATRVFESLTAEEN